MESREYIIKIPPRPWQRARLNGKYFFDGQAKDKLYLGLYLSKLHGTLPKFAGPIELNVIFYMAYPRLMRNRSSTLYHYKRPDLDNLLKYLCDAATPLWDDDCIISKVTMQKIYDEEPRTHLIVRELL